MRRVPVVANSVAANGATNASASAVPRTTASAYASRRQTAPGRPPSNPTQRRSADDAPSELS
jgi:hypothetical protein